MTTEYLELTMPGYTGEDYAAPDCTLLFSRLSLWPNASLWAQGKIRCPERPRDITKSKEMLYEADGRAVTTTTTESRMLTDDPGNKPVNE